MPNYLVTKSLIILLNLFRFDGEDEDEVGFVSFSFNLIKKFAHYLFLLISKSKSIYFEDS